MTDKFSMEDPSKKWPEDIKEAFKNLKIPTLYDSLLVTEKLTGEVHKQNQDIKMIMEHLNLIGTGVNLLLEEIMGEYEDDMYDDLENGDDDSDDDSDNDFDENGDSNFDEDTEESDELKLVEFSEKKNKHSKDSEEDFDEDSEDYDPMLELETLFFTMNNIVMDVTDSIIDLSKSTARLTAQLNDIQTVKKNSLPKDALTSFSLEDQVVEQLVQLVTEKVDAVRYNLMGKLKDLDFQVINPLPGDPFESDKHSVIERIAGGTSQTIARTIQVGYEQDGEVLRPAEVVVYS